MNFGIKVNGNTDDLLSVTLKDVLECVNKPESITWAILWFTATGELTLESVLESESMIDFENRINQSITGIIISWFSLLIMAEQIDQTIEILLIGSTDSACLHRYESDEEMYASCDYSLELVDSSYWLLHSQDSIFIANAKATLPGVEDV